MAYSEFLAERIRKHLGAGLHIEEKKMMGGLTFMVNGKMCVGVVDEELMVRLDPAEQENALKKKGCRVMDFTGKPMKGYVFVNAEGIDREEDLSYWVGLGLAFNAKAKAAKKR